MYIKYLVILNVGLEEVHYFKDMSEMLKFFDVKDLEELKNNRWVSSIYEVKEVLYE